MADIIAKDTREYTLNRQWQTSDPSKFSESMSARPISGTYRTRQNDRGMRKKPKPPLPLGTTGYYSERTDWYELLDNNASVGGLTTRQGAYTYVNNTGTAVRNLNYAPRYPNVALAALANLGSGPLNAGVALGEGKETLAMLAKTAGRLTNFAQALRKGNWKGAADQLGFDLSRSQRSRLGRSVSSARAQRQNMQNGWLEYQYGWMPLLSDAHGAVEAYNNGIAKLGRKVSGKAQRSLGTKRGPSYDRHFVPDDVIGWSRTRAGYSGIISNPNLRTAQELGFLNPAAIAWELVPFSFVADWFFPAGDVIASATATRGLSNVTGWETYEREKYSYIEVTSPLHRDFPYGPRYMTANQFGREVRSTNPFRLKPRFNSVPIASWQRWTSAAALLGQAFFSKRR
jgi:hypothetical protein